MQDKRFHFPAMHEVGAVFEYRQCFHTAPVRAEVWLYIVGIGVFTFAVVELEKWLRFRTPQPVKSS